MKRTTLAACGLALLMTTMCHAEPNVLEHLRTLKAEHPRIIITPSDIDRIKRLIETDDRARAWYEKIKKNADAMLDKPAVTYAIPDGRRLLATSRRVVDSAMTLGLMYQLTDDQRYLDRLWLDIEAASKFKDWNPSHFLDTAEMTAGFGIAYDWCYDGWTEAQRKTMREAIVTKGLLPAKKCYDKKAWWTRSAYNWNQVCNGGIGIGALAIAEDEPQLAAELLSNAITSMPIAIKSYGPDGGWAEGPGYWGYATRYTVAFMASLDTALGTDFGLSQIEGFNQSGDMPVHCTGPTGLTFNFADARATTPRNPEMWWLAKKFDRPGWARFHVQHARPTPLDLIWYDPALLEAKARPLANARMFEGLQAVTMRSAHGDKNALFVGFKAGRNGVNHGNLDLGSFVLESDGVRWAVDLGADNYNLPAYFGGKRWTYYRMRAEGHNTLLINPGKGPDQAKDALAKIASFKTNRDGSIATADLTVAYAPHARSVMRTISLEDENVHCRDRIALKAPGELWWFMHTRAEVVIDNDGRGATLRQNGKQLRVTLAKAPAAAKFTVMPAAPLPTSPNPAGQNPNNGVRKLAIHLSGVKTVQLDVRYEPID